MVGKLIKNRLGYWFHGEITGTTNTKWLSENKGHRLNYSNCEEIFLGFSIKEEFDKHNTDDECHLDYHSFYMGIKACRDVDHLEFNVEVIGEEFDCLILKKL